MFGKSKGINGKRIDDLQDTRSAIYVVSRCFPFERTRELDTDSLSNFTPGYMLSGILCELAVQVLTEKHRLTPSQERVDVSPLPLLAIIKKGLFRPIPRKKLKGLVSSPMSCLSVVLEGILMSLSERGKFPTPMV